MIKLKVQFFYFEISKLHFRTMRNINILKNSEEKGKYKWKKKQKKFLILKRIFFILY